MRDLRITLAPTNTGTTTDTLEAAVAGWNRIATALANIATSHTDYSVAAARRMAGRTLADLET
jgi:hypothetical protein